MYNESEFLSIKEALEKIGMNADHVLQLEYRKTELYLTKLITRTEKTLIKIQRTDGLEVISDRQKSIQNTLNQLIFAHNKVCEMESIIYKLLAENEMLKTRIDEFKTIPN